MSLTFALVQPILHRPPDDEANVADAVRYVEEAAALGADMVAFPETYPGPWRMPATFDPRERMAEVAHRCGVYVQYGTLGPIDEAAGTAHNLLVLVGPAGPDAGVYRRTHPPGPWIYPGGDVWGFNYVAGDEFPVFTTAHGVVGMAMCSEAYIPEVTRALAVQGAEILFLPAGTDKQLLWETWRNLIWSRAIENLAVVVTTQNLFDEGGRGLAMVATPEEIIFETTRPGLFLVSVDLDRIHDLRAQDDGPGSSARNRVKAGLLRQWRRPELYGRAGPPPQAID